MNNKLFSILIIFVALIASAQEPSDTAAVIVLQDPLLLDQTDSLSILKDKAQSYEEYFNRMVRVSPNSSNKNFPVIINGKTVTISNSIEAGEKYSPDAVPILRKARANMITGGVLYGCGLFLLLVPIRYSDGDYFRNVSFYCSLGLDIGGLIFFIRGTKRYGRGLRMYDAQLKKRYGIAPGKKIDLDDF